MSTCRARQRTCRSRSSCRHHHSILNQPSRGTRAESHRKLLNPVPSSQRTSHAAGQPTTKAQDFAGVSVGRRYRSFQTPPLHMLLIELYRWRDVRRESQRAPPAPRASRCRRGICPGLLRFSRRPHRTRGSDNRNAGGDVTMGHRLRRQLPDRQSRRDRVGGLEARIRPARRGICDKFVEQQAGPIGNALRPNTRRVQPHHRAGALHQYWLSGHARRRILGPTELCAQRRVLHQCAGPSAGHSHRAHTDHPRPPTMRRQHWR